MIGRRRVASSQSGDADLCAASTGRSQARCSVVVRPEGFKLANQCAAVMLRRALEAVRSCPGRPQDVRWAALVLSVRGFPLVLEPTGPLRRDGARPLW